MHVLANLMAPRLHVCVVASVWVWVTHRAHNVMSDTCGERWRAVRNGASPFHWSAPLRVFCLHDRQSRQPCRLLARNGFGLRNEKTVRQSRQSMSLVIYCNLD